MAFTYRLEYEDGTPADPPTLDVATPTWRPGETIALGRDGRSASYDKPARARARRRPGASGRVGLGGFDETAVRYKRAAMFRWGSRSTRRYLGALVLLLLLAYLAIRWGPAPLHVPTR